MAVKATGSEAYSAECISAAEALALLSVKPETLYCYVSRGLIRRLAVEDGRSLYAREDVERMRARSIARSGHGPVAAAAVHWGEPILTTALTQVTAAGPTYRGLLATELARSGRSFLDVARYLWSGEWSSAGQPAELDADLGSRLGYLFGQGPKPHIRYVMAQTVLLLASRLDGQQESTDLLGGRLLRALAGCLGFLGPERAFLPLEEDEGIGAGVLRALGAEPSKEACSAVEGALILCADHDLTSATFAGRIAASVGADLYACVGAALNAQFGAEFGLGFDRLEAYLFERATAPLPDRQAPVPMIRYHHPLYPDGDPRARLIAELVASLGPRGRDLTAGLKRQAGRRSADLTIEEALVVLSITLGLPLQSAGALFTLGRAAGWLAHAQEQRDSKFVIRPRAQFLPREPVPSRPGKAPGIAVAPKRGFEAKARLKR